MNSKICSETIEVIAELVTKAIKLEPDDEIMFGFAIYAVGNRLNLKDVASNHKNFDVTVVCGKNPRERITSELTRVLGQTLTKHKTEEIAISNRILVASKRRLPDFAVREYNMPFADYKSQDYTAVKAAQKAFSRFHGSVIMKTDASFHAYGPPVPNKSCPRDFLTASLVLTQKNVVDVDWAMICILRGEAFLRVSHNFKGNIVRAHEQAPKGVDSWDKEEDDEQEVGDEPEGDWKITVHGPWTMATKKCESTYHNPRSAL